MLVRLPALVLLGVVAQPAHAVTVRVPQDQPTVAAGIAAAAAGDTVKIACGSYFESGISLSVDIALIGAPGSPGCVVLDAGGSSYVLRINTSGVVAVQGITFTGATTSGTVVLGSGTTTFRRCVWRANSGPHGGAVRAGGSDARFEYCLFEDNSAATSGGAVHGATRFSDCSFVSNVAGVSGGAINGGDVIERCIFRSNTAAFWGGAVATGGEDARGTVDDCTFVRNTSDTAGGGLHIQGLGATVRDCVFIENDAPKGGGVQLYRGGCFGAGYTVDGCSFTGNRADDGGAILVVGSTGEPPTSAGIYASQFFRNRAASFGGAVNTGAGTNSIVRQCTFTGNSAGAKGSAITVGSGYFVTKMTVQASILAFGSDGVPMNTHGGRMVDFTCVDVFGNADGDFVDVLAGRDDADGNFSADPRFCGLSEGLLSLSVDSPCLPGNHPTGSACGRIGALDAACAGPVTSSLKDLSWGRIKAAYR
jgi:predicted outer membrane repeat protein